MATAIRQSPRGVLDQEALGAFLAQPFQPRGKDLGAVFVSRRVASSGGRGGREGHGSVCGVYRVGVGALGCGVEVGFFVGCHRWSGGMVVKGDGAKGMWFFWGNFGAVLGEVIVLRGLAGRGGGGWGG